jgi:WD domain, G-beta repeat
LFNGKRGKGWLVVAAVLMGFFAAGSAAAQVETVAGAAPEYLWVSHGRLDGHLARHSSPAGAFSPDSSELAVPDHDLVVLMGLAQSDIAKELHPRVKGVTGLEIESVNFLSAAEVLVLATGTIERGSKGQGRITPEMALRWNVQQDTLVGKVEALGAGGGYQPARFLPYIRYLGLNKGNNFDLWNPLTGRAGRLTVPDLTRAAGLFTLSRDGKWMIVGRIEGDASGNPVVISVATHQIVNALGGHGGAALSVVFSRDSRRVATAGADGKVRIYSAPDWKLLQTLSGHHGPVHWADFSNDGRWVVSAGEDKTVRVWSAESGKLLQTLSESTAPVLTVAFAPDDQYIAASTADHVLVWQRTVTGD